MEKTQEQMGKIVANLCKTLTNAKLNDQDLVLVLSQLLFSIGASLEECDGVTSEEVLKRYANNPTLGNVLMAQAMHMQETWSQPERKETHG